MFICDYIYIKKVENFIFFCYIIYNNGFLYINKGVLGLNIYFLFKKIYKNMLYKVFYIVKWMIMNFFFL